MTDCFWEFVEACWDSVNGVDWLPGAHGRSLASRSTQRLCEGTAAKGLSRRSRRWSQLSCTGNRRRRKSVGSARTSGPKKTPDWVGRLTCYSTSIWAFSIIFVLVPSITLKRKLWLLLVCGGLMTQILHVKWPHRWLAVAVAVGNVCIFHL